MPVALVREVPDSFVDCVTRQPGALDPVSARGQHLAYRTLLHEGGFEVVGVPGDEAHPDSVFVEDVAVVIGDRALATRPGHPSRRGEVGPVAGVLSRWCEIEAMAGPATLDGGDVLRVGRTIFVGRSGRTNAEGISVLHDFAAPMGFGVVPVEVGGILHLKSAATALDDGTVLVAPRAVDPAHFGDLAVISVPGGDPHAANVLRLPDGSIGVAEAHPGAAEMIAGLGFRVVLCDISEFAKADGGLTCLSIRIHDR